MINLDAALATYFKNIGKLGRVEIAQKLESGEILKISDAPIIFEFLDEQVNRIIDRLHRPSLLQPSTTAAKREILGNVMDGYSDRSIEILWDYAVWCVSKGA